MEHTGLHLEKFPDVHIIEASSEEYSKQGAMFSNCEKYRYLLWREWNATLPSLAFLMLNPSTADCFKSDPTVTRCLNFARKWGYGKLIVINIFALRSTDPAGLYTCEDPVGQYNDFSIGLTRSNVDKVVCAWGKHGALNNRGKEVIGRIGEKAYYLRLNKDGSPAHPLYLPQTLTPQKFEFLA